LIILPLLRVLSITHPVFDHLHPQEVQALEKGRFFIASLLLQERGWG
jgi:hypothetical protein